MTVKPENPPNVRERMYGLEFLRFLLAFAVMIFHFGYFGPKSLGSTPPEISWGAFAFFGQYGVLVFFLVSGYVITLSLSGRSWSDFLWARAVRLMPALMVCATATFAVLILFEVEGLREIGPLWLKSVSFLPMMFGGHSLDYSYWSIAYEMRFYVLVALLMLLGATRHLDVILLALSLLGIVLGIGLGFVDVAIALLFPHTSLFAVGVLLATRHRDGASRRWGLLFLAHSAIALAMMFLFGELPHDTWGMVLSALVLVSAIGLLLAGAKIRVPANWVGLATVLGMSSYPLYLLHQRIGYVLINLLADTGIAVGWIIPAVMMTMVAAAVGIALYLERPMSAWMRKQRLWTIDAWRNVAPRGRTGTIKAYLPVRSSPLDSAESRLRPRLLATDSK